MSIESGPSGFESQEPRVELPVDDKTLEATVLDPEQSRHLYEHDPVLWIRAAVGVDTGRAASAITNIELAERHSAGGFAEWDPHISYAVAQYLRQHGFVGLYGLREE
ncbi:hypothetical protein HY379_00160 [Candidatus Saccharibacteria bacterium]|nr:hypothetical protein [Candidatus Saccharibacteria bacterium]